MASVQSKADHVRTQLESVGGRLGVEWRNGDIWCKCPFHGGGQERTPSCKVTVDAARGKVGFFWCFACKERPPAGTEHWDYFANATGLIPFRPSQQVNDVHAFSFGDRVASALGERERPAAYQGAPKLPLDSCLAWPDNPWRTIDAATMQLLDARVVYRYNHINAYFPVHVNRNYVGGVYARAEISDADKAAGQLAYINTNGTWANDALFGYNAARERPGPLWIVEGPRDTAKIFQLGARGVGLLSANVSAKKLALIEALDPPCLVIATDPDDAGDRGRAKLLEHFDRMIPCYEVHYPADKDPAKMTPRVYERILDKIGLSAYGDAA